MMRRVCLICGHGFARAENLEKHAEVRHDLEVKA